MKIRSLELAARTEGAGLIQDRTQEHLGYTDRGIVAMRKMILQAISDVQTGKDPPGVIRVGDPLMLDR